MTVNSADDNELLSFLEEESEPDDVVSAFMPWKVLIVDDEEPVHSITKIILDNFEFNKKGLRLFNAYSEDEAKNVLFEHPDISLILLDVVMQHEDSGLNLVKYIRNELNNKQVRIILRTGQPGLAPERKVIIDYDINDYKVKTELTADRLFVSVVSALRAYEDINILVKNEHALEQVIKASTSILKFRYFNDFTDNLLTYLKNIFPDDFIKNNQTQSLLLLNRYESALEIISATGNYAYLNKYNLGVLNNDSIFLFAKKSLIEKKNLYDSTKISLVIDEGEHNQYVYVIETHKSLSEWEKYLLEILTTNLSISLHNISLNDELELTQKEIIFTLGEVAEARSKETGSHVKRMSEYSKVLALNYGLSKEEAALIWLASPVHDIGKLTIPDSILNKPAKLTPDEFEIIKTHSSAGFEMLKNSKRLILQTAAIIAQQHHEKYDGTGYPNGLKGEEIHIYGRITAIADVFDALGSERVYKQPWELDEIIEYIQSESGKHFDPKLVDIFMKSIVEFIRIKNTN